LPRLLVCGDDSDASASLRQTLRTPSLTCDVTWIDRAEGLEEALSRPLDLVICVFRTPGPLLDALLRTVRRSHPELPVIVVGTELDDEAGVDLIGPGVADFVPGNRPKRLRLVISRALALSRDRRARRAADNRRVRARQRIETQQRQTRLAALNMMEDAITARRQAEAAQQKLALSEEKYRLLADHATDFVFWTGPD